MQPHEAKRLKKGDLVFHSDDPSDVGEVHTVRPHEVVILWRRYQQLTPHKLHELQAVHRVPSAAAVKAKEDLAAIQRRHTDA